MKLTELCRVCSRPLELIDSSTVGLETFKVYKCGHFFVEVQQPKEPLDFLSLDSTKKARPYQELGVEFIDSTDGNCIVADQMRLGKTPQALLYLKNKFKRLKAKGLKLQVLIIVKSANVWQWIREYKTWTDSLPNGIWPIEGTKKWIPPGFSAYIISMDTFSRLNTDLLLDFGFNQVVIDEAHGFKNPSSKRAISLINFLTQISKEEFSFDVQFTCICKHSWSETVKILISRDTEFISKTTHCPNCGVFNAQRIERNRGKAERKCSVIFLTGTPIKNNVGEFFVPLNILAPDQFPSKKKFENEWLYMDDRTKKLRVLPYKLKEFKTLIGKFMIRREKEDVYTDLPLINRTFTVVKMDETLKEAYNNVLDKLASKVTSLTYFDSIGELMLLRQICGLGKLESAQNYAEEYLENSDNGKIAIGLHHHAVRGGIMQRLKKYGVVSLSGQDSPYEKDRIMRTFVTDSNRVLAINMLAGGVGMDFHYINNVLVLERQWSSADEEQFEFRFYNPDKSIKSESTNIEYQIVEGTIDEWFYNLVESKRKIFGETLGSQWTLESDASSFKQLMEMTLSHRL